MSSKYLHLYARFHPPLFSRVPRNNISFPLTSSSSISSTISTPEIGSTRGPESSISSSACSVIWRPPGSALGVWLQLLRLRCIFLFGVGRSIADPACALGVGPFTHKLLLLVHASGTSKSLISCDEPALLQSIFNNASRAVPESLWSFSNIRRESLCCAFVEIRRESYLLDSFRDTGNLSSNFGFSVSISTVSSIFFGLSSTIPCKPSSTFKPSILL
mmetsp:Transcript_19948/g.29861  ORF Transcript_19948/g.29861 Transcript_19948/m.29861 type:complete len:217 (-) Transcript_19948:792-1442(-)